MSLTNCSPTPLSSRIGTKKSEASTSSSIRETAQKKVLPNGLTIITLEDHSAPVSSVQVWAKTGSIHETHQMGAGLSHILEHMLFKGTEKRGVAQISRQVEAYGGYINAYTTWDRTVYYIDIPSDGGRPGSSAGTEMAIDILADAMMNSTLPPNEYLLEQKVILRELAMNRDDPDRQSSELLFSTAYREHPSRHPVIGYEEVYRALKREDVMAYYKERYVPNNLIFVVAGDIKTDTVVNQITDLMGKWPRKALPPFYVPDEPLQISERVAIQESRTASEQTRIHIAYQTCHFNHPDAAPLEILAMVAGHGLSSRFYQSLREKKQLVHEIDAWSHNPAWRGVFGVSATCDPDKSIATREAIFAELETFKIQLITQNELSKALKIALSSHLGSRKTMSGQASDIASSELLTGDLNYSEKYLQDLQAVKPQDVRRVAQKYLIPQSRTITVLEPKGTLKTAKQKSTSAKENSIQKKTLPNGLTLLTKQDKKLPFVEIRLVMKSGLLFEEASNNGIAPLTAKLLLKGTKKHTAAEIVNRLESVGGSISPYSGVNSMGVAIEVMNSDTSLGLETLCDIIKNPSFEEHWIKREKQAQIADIRQEREQPVKIAMQSARAQIFGAHPYSMPNLGTEKTVQSITQKQLQVFWKRVAVPSNMVVSIFGDISPEEATKLVERSLGSIKGEPMIAPKTPPPNFGKASRVMNDQDKEQGVVVIGFPGIDIKNPDRASISIMNGALSGMGSRLFLRLRDQLALCYYVGVNEMMGIDPGFIYFYIGTEPSKINEAEKEILSEIEKLKKDGITDEELERSKQGLMGERKMHKQNLGELALAAALDELYGLGFDYSDKLDAECQKTTAQQVHETAKKYLSQPAVISIVKPKDAEK